MSGIADTITRLPVAATLAAFGYISLILIIVFSSVRARTALIFDLAPPSSHIYFSGLDALRGAAALLVASFHTWQWLQPAHNQIPKLLPFLTMGNLGVPIFAGLSGFLIYFSLADRLDTTVQLRRYFVRRILRIYPLFAVTSLVAILTGQIRHDPTIWHGIVSELLMLQIWGFPFRANLPAWSIFVETIFYCFAPIILILAGRRVIAVCITIASVCLLVGHSASREFQLIPFFALGALAAHLNKGMIEANAAPDRSIRNLILFFISALIFYLVFSNIRPLAQMLNSGGRIIGMPLPFDPERGPDLAFGLFLLLLTLPQLRFAILDFRIIRFFGIVSYGIYLWHPFILTANVPIRMDGWGKLVGTMPPAADGGWLTFLGVYIPAIIFAGAASYALVERPFLRLRRV